MLLISRQGKNIGKGQWIWKIPNILGESSQESGRSKPRFESEGLVMKKSRWDIRTGMGKIEQVYWLRRSQAAKVTELH